MYGYLKSAAFLSLVVSCVSTSAMAQTAGGPSGPVREVPTRAAPVMRDLATLAPSQPVVVATQPVTVKIDIPADVRPRMATALAAPAGRSSLILNVNEISFTKTPDGYFEVYVNLPQGQEPNHKSEFFAGTLAFFGLQSEAGGSRRDAAFNIDITAAVRALQARGLWKGDEVTVTFVPTARVDREGRRLPVSADSRVTISNLKVVAATTD
jgi:hypothetical protein